MAGTLFDRHRTLTVWFEDCWQFATVKDGISALGLQPTLEIGSYQTAWAKLHRLRSVLVRPGRHRLSGTVEVDETYFGGEGTGPRGGCQKGKKALVAWLSNSKHPGPSAGAAWACSAAHRPSHSSVSSPRTSSQDPPLSPMGGRATAGRPEPLRAPADQGEAQRPAAPRRASGSTPRRFLGQALGPQHPPGLGRQLQVKRGAAGAAMEEGPPSEPRPPSRPTPLEGNPLSRGSHLRWIRRRSQSRSPRRISPTLARLASLRMRRSRHPRQCR